MFFSSSIGEDAGDSMLMRLFYKRFITEFKADNGAVNNNGHSDRRKSREKQKLTKTDGASPDGLFKKKTETASDIEEKFYAIN